MIPFKILHGFEIIGHGKTATTPLIGDVILTDEGIFRVKQRAFDIRAEKGEGLCLEVEPIKEHD